MSVEKYGWAFQKKLICIDQSGFYIFSHPQELKNVKHENSKMLNITSKHFSFLTINHLQAESRK